MFDTKNKISKPIAAKHKFLLSPGKLLLLWGNSNFQIHALSTHALLIYCASCFAGMYRKNNYCGLIDKNRPNTQNLLTKYRYQDKKPPDKTPPDINPLAKSPLDKNSPCQKPPGQKPSRENL